MFSITFMPIFLNTLIFLNYLASLISHPHPSSIKLYSINILDFMSIPLFSPMNTFNSLIFNNTIQNMYSSNRLESMDILNLNRY